MYEPKYVELLMSKGLTRQQCESSTANKLLTCLAEEAGLLDEIMKQKVADAERCITEYTNAKSYYNRKLEELQWREDSVKRKEANLEWKISDYEESVKTLEKSVTTQKEELNKQREAILTMETPEARDKMRMAYFLLAHSTDDFETAANRSSFFLALGSIFGNKITTGEEE